jgi:hypothetical protein
MYQSDQFPGRHPIRPRPVPYRYLALGPVAIPAVPDLMHHGEILAYRIKNSMTHRYLT